MLGLPRTKQACSMWLIRKDRRWEGRTKDCCQILCSGTCCDIWKLCCEGAKNLKPLRHQLGALHFEAGGPRNSGWCANDGGFLHSVLGRLAVTATKQVTANRRSRFVCKSLRNEAGK